MEGLIFNNFYLDIVCVSLFTAQALKVIIAIFREKKLNFRYFLDTGRMPSSHSSSVVSLAAAIAFIEGLSSTNFAISAVLAAVVMYDATGVRRAAGLQAQTLNKIAESFKKKEGLQILDKNLKEFLGHTPLEVFWGAILGILIAFIMTRGI
ncbi:MAG: divergent PAP2 family protein [Candidatus Cloacimonetes bacterium]|nr:divergent PAP2 family protein [Candidatus Cloacimonadota bacterium]